MAQEADEHPAPEDVVVWSWDMYDKYVKNKLDVLRPNSSVAEEALRLYPHKNDTDPEYQFTSMVSDIRAICPLDDLVRDMSRSFRSPIYRYVITSAPSRPVNQHGSLKRYAFRGWDLITFFGTSDMYLDTITTDDKKFSKNLRRAVLEFVRSGKISRWRNWTKFPDRTAVIDSQLNFVSKYHEEECRFWGQQGFLPGFSWIN